MIASIIIEFSEQLWDLFILRPLTLEYFSTVSEAASTLIINVTLVFGVSILLEWLKEYNPNKRLTIRLLYIEKPLWRMLVIAVATYYLSMIANGKGWSAIFMGLIFVSIICSGCSCIRLVMLAIHNNPLYGSGAMYEELKSMIDNRTVKLEVTSAYIYQQKAPFRTKSLTKEIMSLCPADADGRSKYICDLLKGLLIAFDDDMYPYEKKCDKIILELFVPLLKDEIRQNVQHFAYIDHLVERMQRVAETQNNRKHREIVLAVSENSLGKIDKSVVGEDLYGHLQENLQIIKNIVSGTTGADTGSFGSEVGHNQGIVQALNNEVPVEL